MADGLTLRNVVCSAGVCFVVSCIPLGWIMAYGASPLPKSRCRQTRKKRPGFTWKPWSSAGQAIGALLRFLVANCHCRAVIGWSGRCSLLLPLLGAVAVGTVTRAGSATGPGKAPGCLFAAIGRKPPGLHLAFSRCRSGLPLL